MKKTKLYVHRNYNLNIGIKITKFKKKIQILVKFNFKTDV